MLSSVAFQKSPKFQSWLTDSKLLLVPSLTLGTGDTAVTTDANLRELTVTWARSTSKSAN